MACATAKSCWASGTDFASSEEPLLETWQGSSWSLATPATPPLGEGQLSGIACASKNECWAAGNEFSDSVQSGYPLIEEWNGQEWSSVVPPTPADAQGFLYGVTCLSDSDCWAVGSYYDGHSEGSSSTLIERWNGSSWSDVSSPNPTDLDVNNLSGVACVSSKDCWAVGGGSGDGMSMTIAEKWNGSTWSLVASPDAEDDSGLAGVSCKSASLCFAVGGSGAENVDVVQTLIEQWNGHAWAIVQLKNPSGNVDSGLRGVSCTVLSSCWTVGSQEKSRHLGTLTEQYAPDTASAESG